MGCGQSVHNIDDPDMDISKHGGDCPECCYETAQDISSHLNAEASDAARNAPGPLST